jgi:hypothetical protein
MWAQGPPQSAAASHIESPSNLYRLFFSVLDGLDGHASGGKMVGFDSCEWDNLK